MSDLRVDALTELVTLGIGQAAEVLNLILNSHIDLSAPVIRILDAGDLPEALKAHDKRLSAVSMRYNGSMDGVEHQKHGSHIGMVEGAQGKTRGTFSLLWDQRQFSELGNVLLFDGADGLQMGEQAEPKAKHELGRIWRVPEAPRATQAADIPQPVFSLWLLK